jgi:hypothetical protein
MLQSLPPGDPNPRAYPLEDAPHGATTAFPNIASAKTVARELAVARRLGIHPFEVFDYPDAEVARRLAAELAGRVCLYVVTIECRMFLIPAYIEGRRLTHTMAADGADVVAAGQVELDSDGRVVWWDHLSGHYRPDERQAREVAAGFFTLGGLRSTRTRDKGE